MTRRAVVVDGRHDEPRASARADIVREETLSLEPRKNKTIDRSVELADRLCRLAAHMFTIFLPDAKRLKGLKSAALLVKNRSV